MGSGCCILSTELSGKKSGRGERPQGSALRYVDKRPGPGNTRGSVYVKTVASLLIALSLPTEIHSTFGQGNNSAVFIEIYIC